MCQCGAAYAGGHTLYLLLVLIYSQEVQYEPSSNQRCLSCRYYSATILQMSGVQDDRLAIWLAALTAFINFIFTLVGVWLVERMGRRKLTLGSLTGERFVSELDRPHGNMNKMKIKFQVLILSK